MKDKTKVMIIASTIFVVGVIEVCTTVTFAVYANESAKKMELVNKESDDPKNHFDGTLKLMRCMIALVGICAVPMLTVVIIILVGDLIKFNAAIGFTYVGLLAYHLAISLVIVIAALHQPGSEQHIYYQMPTAMLSSNIVLCMIGLICSFILWTKRYWNISRFNFMGHQEELRIQQTKTKSHQIQAKNHGKPKGGPPDTIMSQTRSKSSQSSAKNHDSNEKSVHSGKSESMKPRKSKQKGNQSSDVSMPKPTPMNTQKLVKEKSDTERSTIDESTTEPIKEKPLKEKSDTEETTIHESTMQKSSKEMKIKEKTGEGKFFQIFSDVDARKSIF